MGRPAMGLVLSRQTSCENGVWLCATDASQGTVSCGYSKTCDAKACDGSACVPVHQSATAQCVNSSW